MATIKEHIAQHTRPEAVTQQQPVADDPLAPTPIRFTYRRDADGVIHKPTVNEPTTGWHLEDDSAGEDAEPSPRQRGQAYTPSRQTRDYQQQARVTQAYPPDYDDADDQYTALARIPRIACAASVSLGMLPINSTILPHDAGSTGPCSW